MARPKFEYLLFDLPSDHEVEQRLATESASIESIVHNKSLGGRLKRVCVASKERFLKLPNHSYDVAFVHLACHGGVKGIGLLGGQVPWAQTASTISAYLRPLVPNQQRVMALSCCHSADGLAAVKTPLKPYFTGFYYFKEEEVGFATSVTVWSMFYLKKSISNPHAKIVADINNFLGKEVICFSKS
jgi:hypothetical protein